MENSGNEAKKYLKTKENGFFNDANCARFARNFARIGYENERKCLILPKTSRSLLLQSGLDGDRRGG